MNSEMRDYWFTVLEVALRGGASSNDALLRATTDTASVFELGPARCDHGIIKSEWCGQCETEQAWAKKMEAIAKHGPQQP
jgi:hypothetical protein